MDTAPAPATAPEIDRLLARRQAILEHSHSLWDRASALENGEKPPQDAYTQAADDYDHGDPQKARWHAEDYDEQTAGALDALLGHIKDTGQIPTAWRTPLPDGATTEEADRYAASLTVPEGGHIITKQFTVTARLHESRWVIDPSSLSGDAFDDAALPVHEDDCPCGLAGQDVIDALEQADALPAPTPGQFADSTRHAYAIATTPPIS